MELERRAREAGGVRVQEILEKLDNIRHRRASLTAEEAGDLYFEEPIPPVSARRCQLRSSNEYNRVDGNLTVPLIGTSELLEDDSRPRTCSKILGSPDAKTNATLFPSIPGANGTKEEVRPSRPPSVRNPRINNYQQAKIEMQSAEEDTNVLKQMLLMSIGKSEGGGTASDQGLSSADPAYMTALLASFQLTTESLQPNLGDESRFQIASDMEAQLRKGLSSGDSRRGSSKRVQDQVKPKGGLKPLSPRASTLNSIKLEHKPVTVASHKVAHPSMPMTNRLSFKQSPVKVGRALKSTPENAAAIHSKAPAPPSQPKPHLAESKPRERPPISLTIKATPLEGTPDEEQRMDVPSTPIEAMKMILSTKDKQAVAMKTFQHFFMSKTARFKAQAWRQWRLQCGLPLLVQKKKSLLRDQKKLEYIQCPPQEIIILEPPDLDHAPIIESKPKPHHTLEETDPLKEAAVPLDEMKKALTSKDAKKVAMKNFQYLFQTKATRQKARAWRQWRQSIGLSLLPSIANSPKPNSQVAKAKNVVDAVNIMQKKGNTLKVIPVPTEEGHIVIDQPPTPLGEMKLALTSVDARKVALKNFQHLFMPQEVKAMNRAWRQWRLATGMTLLPPNAKRQSCGYVDTAVANMCGEDGTGKVDSARRPSATVSNAVKKLSKNSTRHVAGVVDARTVDMYADDHVWG